MQNATTEYRTSLYFAFLLSIFKANCLRKTFALQDLGTLKDSMAP